MRQRQPPLPRPLAEVTFLYHGMKYSDGVTVDQGFPTWGRCIPGVHWSNRRGTFQVGNRREKYIYILFISKYCYTYITE